MVRGRVLCCLLAAGACGDGSGSSAADASSLPDGACPLPAGRLYVASRFLVEGPGEGFDLNGDGLVDNSLGNVPDAERANMNATLDVLISNGQLLTGIYITGWSDPPTADDADLTAHLFAQLIDADMDVSNNLTGQGSFYIDKDSFDLSCNFAETAQESSLEASVLSARRSFATFRFGTFATLELANTQVVFQFVPDFTAASGQMGAIATACSLSAMPYPSDPTVSAINKVVNDPALSEVRPDIDVDGDGLEMIVGDGVDIVECIDGDGTHILGSDCICHPAIADGFSVAVDLPIVLATALQVL